MKVLITGATGFIGSRLTLRCLEQGQTVRVLGQNRNPAEEENVRLLRERGAEVVIASVTEPDSLVAAHDGIDVVYHLAAAQHEANVPDQHFWDVNVEGTRNMLDAAAVWVGAMMVVCIALWRLNLAVEPAGFKHGRETLAWRAW